MTYALDLKQVRKSFGHLEIIGGIDLQVSSGEKIAIIGPNGAGKSTLFHLISGHIPIESGEILIHGKNIRGFKPYQIARLGLSRSFQVSNIFHRLTVYDTLRSAVLWKLGYRYSFWHRLNSLRDVHDQAEQVMEQIGLHHRRHVVSGALTYAEQRALEMGMVIAGDPQVLLLDEPTAGMSRPETEAMVHLIREVSVGKTLLIVEHDMSVVFGLADKLAVLVRGKMIAYDTPVRVRADLQVQEAYLGEQEQV